MAGLPDVYKTFVGASPISGGAKGERITITGTVLDAHGAPCRDAMIESWQADAAGVYPGHEGADPAVTGFARFAVDPKTGEYSLKTVKPGPAARDTTQAPHVALWIVARGINVGLQTRIYFEDEDNSVDPLLGRIEQKARRDTLIATKTAEGRYRFDICLQGEDETVFLDM
jgi:protocatechuate 3,4-dioxygenase alpha subunit